MKTLSIFIRLILVIGGLGLMMYGCEKSAERQERFAIEHNCKWDYNDICYTRDQRPWLFD